MATDPARNLRLVDTDTGELVETDCPGCAERDLTYKELERKYRGALTQIGNLRADKEAAAPKHKLWPDAIMLWTEWRVATGRLKCRWSADRFWLVEPYLRADGFVVCRWAVWGVAYEPNRRTLPSGLVETYDDWELCFRNRGTFERYVRRGYTNPEAREQFLWREQGRGPKDQPTGGTDGSTDPTGTDDP